MGNVPNFDQAEENFRRSIEESLLGIRIVTEEGETLYANRAMLEIYGYDSVEELRATRTKDRYTPESYSELQKRLEKRRQGDNTPSEYEVDIVRKDGEVRHLELFRKETLWNGKRQCQIIYQDITERKRAEEALQKSEKRFHTSVENLFEGFAILSSVRDSDGHIIDFRYEYINEAGCKMNHKSKEEHLGRTLLELFPKQRETGLFDDCVKVLNTGQPVSKEYVLHEPLYGGGKRLKQALNYHVIRFEDGLVGTWQDTTEKKRGEESLKQSEERLRRLVENSKDVIMMTDLEGRILYYSGLLEFGFTSQDLLGKNPFEFFEPLTAAKLMSQLKHVVREKKALAVEDLITLKKESFWFSLQIYPIEDKGNRITAVGIIARNITDRKQAEETLRKSEERYKRLVERSPDVVWSFSNRRGTLYASARAEAILGYSPDYLYKNPWVWNESIHPDDRDHISQAISDFVSGKDLDLEYRIKDALGNWRWLRDRSINRYTRDDETIIEGLSTDITERKQAEERLKSSTQELRALAERLQSAREEERTEVAREIHDELGQALTALKMDLSWLRKKLPKDQESLHEKTRSMSQLLDATVRTVKRISTELRPGLLDDLGLAAAIEWQSEEFQNRTGIKCSVTTTPEEVVLEAKLSTAIFRIFQETLTNAARHAKATKVKVSLKQKATKLELKVEDNGKGITEKQISSPKSLGLIGMRERVYLWEGELKIIGNPGKGTTVTVTIPIKKE